MKGTVINPYLESEVNSGTFCVTIGIYLMIRNTLCVITSVKDGFYNPEVVK